MKYLSCSAFDGRNANGSDKKLSFFSVRENDSCPCNYRSEGRVTWIKRRLNLLFLRDVMSSEKATDEKDKSNLSKNRNNGVNGGISQVSLT